MFSFKKKKKKATKQRWHSILYFIQLFRLIWLLPHYFLARQNQPESETVHVCSLKVSNRWLLILENEYKRFFFVLIVFMIDQRCASWISISRSTCERRKRVENHYKKWVSLVTFGVRSETPVSYIISKQLLIRAKNRNKKRFMWHVRSVCQKLHDVDWFRDAGGDPLALINTSVTKYVLFFFYPLLENPCPWWGLKFDPL